MKTITVHELKSLLDRPNGSPVDLIDVRTAVEFETFHVPGARLMPMDELDCDALLKHRAENAPLYLLCQSGSRARKVAERFASAGFHECVVVEGGSKAWENAGLPTIRGRQTISLERQVRIAAGTLALVGVSLGFALHPAFFVLSALVGCGLIFAGITDWCGMGLLLAKMPWNIRVFPNPSAQPQA